MIEAMLEEPYFKKDVSKLFPGELLVILTFFYF